ncbi:MAG: tyrosine-type recombinase/integrase [Sphingomicrobium sp.]
MGRPTSNPEKLPPYVTAYTDRHGKRRYRYRKAGYSYHFKEHPGTPSHPSAEYTAILAGQRPTTKRAAPGTVRDLVNRYYQSSAFTNPGPITQQKVHARLEDFCRAHGHRTVVHCRFNHIDGILAQKMQITKNADGRKIGGPNAAKSLEKDLTRLFDLAVKLEWIKTNPVQLSDGVKVGKTAGFHSWTDEEIAQFQGYYPLGTMPRLALEIMLWTLLRRSDARLFGPQHRNNGRVRIQNVKTKKFTDLPEACHLTEALEAMDLLGTETYLLSNLGEPFKSSASFGNWFRHRCNEAGLSHCSAHGLRKATARRLAEAGATQQQLKAVGNWSQDKDVAKYTAAADQKRLAINVMTRLAEWDRNRKR